MNQPTKQEPTLEEQQQLHAATVSKLSQVFAENIGDMTLETAINVAIDFAAASLIYVFRSTGKLGVLRPNVVVAEFARRLGKLKKMQK